MPKLAVVDYGAGNIRSMVAALERATDDDIVVTDRSEDILSADRVVLPGVGAGGAVVSEIRARGLEEPLHEFVFERQRPFLGICVGMQVMADRLFEFGEHKGLGWIAGDIVRLDTVIDEAATVPNMGWRPVRAAQPSPFLEANRDKNWFYFAHSFCFKPREQRSMVGEADYFGPYCVAVGRDNVIGVQFHPEKSQQAGLKMLSRFCEWAP